MRKRNSLFNSYVFIFPSLFLTLALGIYPLIWAFRYMFYDYQGYGEEKFIGIDNFTRLLRDTEYWHSVYNTMIYAGGKLIIVLPLSLILAVILNRGIKGKVLLRAVYFMPTIISTSVMAIVFFTIFNSYNGLLNQFLLKYGLISKAIDWLGPDYAMITVIIMAIWGAIGNYMLLFIAGLQGIPDDLYESASIDGANVVQKFWYITIPMLGPVLQMIVMLAIINSLKGYESIMVMTEGGPFGKTDVMYLYVYKLFFPVSAVSPTVQQIGYGSAAGFVTALIVGLITIVYFAMSKRLNQD
ncbi:MULTISPECIES: sugar ABC transporter permease [Paenibacillus]|uniref:Sugar ABC transporter permease n=1 Tax=Paenibacillus violae TaxID=3077234 RepID=A0ABU3RBX1_9BACL|nr:MULTISPECIES: sugar ABC transporter permease [Paenibacillus]MDU0201756.1 sugar ABC transporter permease [Paenibacillus sp. PFR10]MEC0268857.1 sugar ABC transporter permease [Paenibacillus anseongense]